MYPNLWPKVRVFGMNLKKNKEEILSDYPQTT
jgi:hypothetical protein